MEPNESYKLTICNLQCENKKLQSELYTKQKIINVLMKKAEMNDNKNQYERTTDQIQHETHQQNQQQNYQQQSSQKQPQQKQKQKQQQQTHQ